ncbi:MAG: DUF971 domain-containing protein [Polyangiales bacterium]
MNHEKTMTTPTAVRAPVGAAVFEIDWADGVTGAIPNELLRAYCPCAGCQGHTGTIRYLAGGNSVIEGIEEVGAYALGITWGDGHASGIYTFRYLRRLGELAADPSFARAHPEIPRAQT